MRRLFEKPDSRYLTETDTEVVVCVMTENECDVSKGEYETTLIDVKGLFTLDYDVELLNESLAELVIELKIKEEGYTNIKLKKYYEREDVFFNSMYLPVWAEPDDF